MIPASLQERRCGGALLRRSAVFACNCLRRIRHATAPAARVDLLEIFDAARALRQPRIVDGIPDYTAAAVDAQRRGLVALRARFDALDPGAWPVRDQVDYLLVRSDLDMLDYGLNVYRATSRSPNFYSPRYPRSGCPAARR